MARANPWKLALHGDYEGENLNIAYCFSTTTMATRVSKRRRITSRWRSRGVVIQIKKTKRPIDGASYITTEWFVDYFGKSCGPNCDCLSD